MKFFCNMIYCYFERLQILKKRFRKHNECPCTYLQAWPPLQITASAILPASPVPGSSQAGMWLDRNNSMSHLNKLGLEGSSSGAFCSLADQTTKERLSLYVQNSSVYNDYVLVCILTGLVFRTENLVFVHFSTYHGAL